LAVPLLDELVRAYKLEQQRQERTEMGDDAVELDVDAPSAKKR
jgi:hypothetical protein